MTTPAYDEQFMQAALLQAKSACIADEVPVGAVMVINQKIIASGFNQTLIDTDPSAHAEIITIRRAARAVGNHRLVDATLYVTLEPCIMCAGAIIEARLKRVVFAAFDHKRGAAGSVFSLLDQKACNHRVPVTGGILELPAKAQLQTFFQAKRLSKKEATV